MNSLRPTLVLPPEAAAQTHTVVRERTQLQKEFGAMLALGLSAAFSFSGVHF